MVPQRPTHKASRGERTSELGEGQWRVFDISWWWNTVYPWSSPLYRFSSEGELISRFQDGVKTAPNKDRTFL